MPKWLLGNVHIILNELFANLCSNLCRFFQKLGDISSALKFLVLSGCQEDAFQMAEVRFSINAIVTAQAPGIYDTKLNSVRPRINVPNVHTRNNISMFTRRSYTTNRVQKCNYCVGISQLLM